MTAANADDQCISGELCASEPLMCFRLLRDYVIKGRKLSCRPSVSIYKCVCMLGEVVRSSHVCKKTDRWSENEMEDPRRWSGILG